MDSHSPDAKAAFRKSANDNSTSTRNYRRRSPTNPSPPPGSSPERRGHNTQNVSRQERTNDDGRIRKNDDRYDRRSSKHTHDYRRRDDDRANFRNSHDSRDRRDRDYDHEKNEIEYKRSRDKDKHYETKHDDDDGAGYKSKYAERKLSSVSMENDMHLREKDVHYGSRGRVTTRTGRSSFDDRKAYRTDLSDTTKGGGSNESDIADYQKSTKEGKTRFDHRENKLTRERDHWASRTDNEEDSKSRQPASPSKKPKFTSDHSKETFSETSTQPNNANDADNTNSVDAAKVAAMRAAELVNKNLVGVGMVGALSTDQKKKLLWGSKKKAVEETGHCWDASLFPDREQQEKFNRLMGVKGEVKVEQKSGNSEGKSTVNPEKQKELLQDLEKQYTAGLRRKDGRTVGLGL